MSLLSQAMENCITLKYTKVSDGYGGNKGVYTEDTSFKAAIVFDNSIEARIGEKQGVTSLYTVTTDKNTILNYHDIFKRISDDKIFRVTSDGDDKYTPSSATLNMRQVTAEEFILTSAIEEDGNE